MGLYATVFLTHDAQQDAENKDELTPLNAKKL
jgi:hypothetical protein